MRSKVFMTVAAINIGVLALLFGIWWANGKSDTGLYVSSGLIVISSFFYLKNPKKDTDQ